VRSVVLPALKDVVVLVANYIRIVSEILEKKNVVTKVKD
jgi:hypothetical protein